MTGIIGPVRWTLASVLLSAAVLGACSAGVQMGDPVARPALQAGMGCEQAQAFAFSGETSLAAIGLADEFGGGQDAQRVGMVWVTADAIDMFGPGGRPPGAQADPQRMVCVEWPDGSGMAGSLPAGWEPPPAFDRVAQPEDAGPQSCWSAW